MPWSTIYQSPWGLESDIQHAKALLRDHGYFVIYDCRVRDLTYSSIISLADSNRDEQYVDRTESYIASAMGRKLLEDGAMTRSGRLTGNQLDMALELSVKVVMPKIKQNNNPTPENTINGEGHREGS